MIAKEKPSKKHYNRFMKRINAVWVIDVTEQLTNILKSTINDVEFNETFYPYYPTELALKYGLTHGLIRIEKFNEKYYTVYFTEKGMQDNIKKQKTTCAFTGRRVRGEF